MKIEDMPAGRELNDAVAQHVMGWKPLGTQTPPEAWEDGNIIRTAEPMSFTEFNPSENITAAWKVVEKLDGIEFDQFVDIAAETFEQSIWLLTSEELAEQICRAALAAVE